jgi:hypothetical protein
MIGRVFLGLAIAIAMVSGSAAQNTPATHEVLSFAERPVSDYTADFRPRFIRTLAKYCQDVLNALPTNTPAEDAWIASEEKTKDREELQRLFDSKEYSRSILKNTFSECEHTTKLLSEIKKLVPEGGTERLRLETSLFIKLALNFNVSLESYSSKIELNENVKARLGGTYFQVVRQGVLTAAVKTLQDVR